MHRSDRLASDDQRASAYLRRRRYVRACLGAAFVAAGAGAALLLAAAAHALAEPSGGLALGQWLEERIKALLGGLGALLPPEVIRVLVTDYPAHTVAAVGGLTALLRARAVARRLHDRFFDAVDPRVLRPVRRPRGLALGADRGAEALPWVEPAGARGIAWDALHAWAGAPPAGPAVSWCVLVGRPGAGKTRTAHELARRLARRDLLGAPFGPLPGPEARARALRAARLSLGAFLRSAAGRWRDGDPWDAGELHPEVLGGAWHRLEGWRPRRPTLLLLDDPLTGETSRVLACLRKGAEDEDRPFRHAVRLLVVHQTVPADLGARREDGAWTARESGGRPPVGLPDEARFSEDEVARLARGMLGRRAAVLSGRASLASFVRETEGNPLLVELGLHWLRDRQPLAEMSRTALLRHRAGRVVEALERAGMPPGGILAAAAATVAGGGPRTAFEAFGILPSAERLAPAFPLDVPLGAGLPPVRPDLIGYAFARRVVEGAEPAPAADAEQSARRIAEAAWRANPRGTLRTVARLATGEDPLAVALRAGPPSPWAGSRQDLALAYVEQAVLRGGALAPARRELARLTPGEAAEAVATIAAFLAAPGAGGEAGMECFAAALERALSNAALQADPRWVARALTETASALTEGFHRGLGPGTDWGAFVAPVRALVGQAAGAAAPPAAGAAGPAGTLAALLPALRALEDAVWQAWDHHAELIPVVQALESVPGLEPGDRARLGVRALAMQGARAEAWARAEALEAAAGPAADRTAVAEAWAAVSHALALDAGATAGEEVARLAERVAGLGPGAGVARQEARIRMHAAFLGAGAPEADADGTARAADRITVLLDQHPHDPGIRQEQAVAYRFAAHALAMRGDLDAARAMARRIDAMAAQHPEDRRILRARVSAWTSLGVALADAGAGEALARVAEEIDAMAAPYGGDRVIARDRFAVWERVLHALPEPDGASAAEMDAVAARLDEIAAALSGIPAIGHARVQAWVLVLDALAKAGTRAAAERADGVAAHVDGLCAASDAAPAVALLQAGAWRAVAAAHAGLGPEGSARAQAAAERVAALSAPFAEDPDFLVETIRAWRHVARAHALADGGLGVGDARAVAERVDALVAAHPPSARLAAHRLDVWSQVAFGLLSDPDPTRGGEAVVRVAHHVEGIGAAHPADRDVQAEVARVWWSAAKQFADVHAGAGAHRCAEVVERLERLAARFPGDREFDLRVATAHALLAEAHSRRPLGEGKEAAETAARAAERRAGGHAGDVAFANAAAHAWVTVAMAISKRVTPGHAALAHAVAEHVEALGRPYPLAADLRFTQVDAWRATAGVAANDWEGVPPEHVRTIGEHVDRIAAPFRSEERFRIFCAATWISVARAYASRGAVGDVQGIVAQIEAQLAGSPDDPTCVELRAQAASCLALAHANTGPQGLDAAEAAARRVDALAEPFPAIREFARDRVWGWMAVVRAALEAGALRRAQESAWRMDACAEPIADDPSPMLERVRAWAWIVCALADEDPAGARQARDHLDQIAAPFAAIPVFQAHLEMARLCVGEGEGDDGFP